MKTIFVFFFVIALAYAIPLSPVPAKPRPPPQAQQQHHQDPSDSHVVRILKSDYHHEPEGPYVFNFETEDGITRNEVGELKQVKDEEGHEETVVVSHGSYSYPDPDGKLLTVTYTADENGFHAEGEHIPK